MSNEHDAKYLKDVTYPTSGSGVKYLTEQEEARERLKRSVDSLAQQASLQVNMQKEPLKMLGGASAVGAVLGLMVGRQFKKTKTVYVDAGSPAKYQKELVKAQHKQQNQNVGGALVATLGTLAFKMVMDKVVTPKLEEVTSGLLERAGQPGTKPTSAQRSTPAARSAGVLPVSPAPVVPAPVSIQFDTPSMSPAGTVSPISTGGVSSFVKPVHPGVVPLPESHVEAKAVGTPIAPQEQVNPNSH